MENGSKLNKRAGCIVNDINSKRVIISFIFIEANKLLDKKGQILPGDLGGKKIFSKKIKHIRYLKIANFE